MSTCMLDKHIHLQLKYVCVWTVDTLTDIIVVVILLRRWPSRAARFEKFGIWCEIETGVRIKASDSKSNIHGCFNGFCNFQPLNYFWWRLLERLSTGACWKRDLTSLLLGIFIQRSKCLKVAWILQKINRINFSANTNWRVQLES